jgi:hypothetical protein
MTPDRSAHLRSGTVHHENARRDDIAIDVHLRAYIQTERDKRL